MTASLNSEETCYFLMYGCDVARLVTSSTTGSSASLWFQPVIIDLPPFITQSSLRFFLCNHPQRSGLQAGGFACAWFNLL